MTARRLRPWLAIAAMALVAGCAIGQWRRPNSTQADFQRDLAQCDLMIAPSENVQQPVPLLAGLGHGLTNAEKYCLRDRGWVP